MSEGKIGWLCSPLVLLLACGSYTPPPRVSEIRVLYLQEPAGDHVRAGRLYLDMDGDGEEDRSVYIWEDRTWTLGDETGVGFYNIEVATGEIDREGNLKNFPPEAMGGASSAWIDGNVEIVVNGTRVPKR